MNILEDNKNTNICLICREDVSIKKDIQLNCECSNSYYHVKCIGNWINLQSQNNLHRSLNSRTIVKIPKCLNCYCEINQLVLSRIFLEYNTRYNKDDDNKNDSDITNFIIFGINIKVSYIMMYLMSVILYLLLNIVTTDNSNVNSLQNYNICTVHLIAIKLHIKMFFQYCKLDLVNNRLRMILKDNSKEFFVKYSSLVKIYICTGLIGSLSGLITSFILNYNEKKTFLINILMIIFLIHLFIISKYNN